jgi:hypothetical protein
MKNGFAIAIVLLLTGCITAAPTAQQVVAQFDADIAACKPYSGTSSFDPCMDRLQQARMETAQRRQAAVNALADGLDKAGEGYREMARNPAPYSHPTNCTTSYGPGPYANTSCF